MFNSTNFFNGLFGKVQPGMCRITMNGDIAVKCNDGYKSYNLKRKKLTNVTNFCFNAGDEFFFVIPTTKVAKGDIILVGGKPKCVLALNEESIKVIDYETSEIREVVPERHVFMGSTYFYGKIVSMFGNLKGGKGLKGMMKMAMMSQMFGNNNTSNNSMFGGNVMQMMMMSSMFGGKDNVLDGMFDELSFGSDVEEDTDVELDNEED